MLCRIMVELSGNGLSGIWRRHQMWSTKTSLMNSIRLGGSIFFIVTRSNLVVTWMGIPQMSIVSWSPLGLRWFTRASYISCSFLQLNFQFVQKKKTLNLTTEEFKPHARTHTHTHHVVIICRYCLYHNVGCVLFHNIPCYNNSLPITLP